CNLLGWITRAAEVWLVLYLLHAGVSVAMALVIEAFGTGIGFATFFLPVDIGVEEGGAVATFLALGLSGGTGLSLSLVRRIREVAWVALGLLLLAGKPKPSRAAVERQAGCRGARDRRLRGAPGHPRRPGGARADGDVAPASRARRLRVSRRRTRRARGGPAAGHRSRDGRSAGRYRGWLGHRGLERRDL